MKNFRFEFPFSKWKEGAVSNQGLITTVRVEVPIWELNKNVPYISIKDKLF